MLSSLGERKAFWQPSHKWNVALAQLKFGSNTPRYFGFDFWIIVGSVLGLLGGTYYYDKAILVTPGASNIQWFSAQIAGLFVLYLAVLTYGQMLGKIDIQYRAQNRASKAFRLVTAMGSVYTLSYFIPADPNRAWIIPG